LQSYLRQKVFAGAQSERTEPIAKQTEGFAAYMRRYVKGFAIERAAVENLEQSTVV
jgi:hypothetical protein